jgi:hypothetical protein
MLIEETAKQITGSKVSNNMAVAIAAPGGMGTPGQLYAYGGVRVLADLQTPVFFFSGHMRVGLTMA